MQGTLALLYCIPANFETFSKGKGTLELEISSAPRDQSQSTQSVGTNPAWVTCSNIPGEELLVASWLSDK